MIFVPMIYLWTWPSQGGGPFYPVLTGRRDSLQSFFQEATDQIPRPDDNITRTLHLFNLRGFNARETVSLLGKLLYTCAFMNII